MTLSASTWTSESEWVEVSGAVAPGEQPVGNGRSLGDGLLSYITSTTSWARDHAGREPIARPTLSHAGRPVGWVGDLADPNNPRHEAAGGDQRTPRG